MHHDISAEVVTDAFPDSRDKRAAENPSPTRRRLGKSQKSLFRKYRHVCMTDLREICFADDIPVFYPCGKADPDISSEPRAEVKRDKNFGFDFGPPSCIRPLQQSYTHVYRESVVSASPFGLHLKKQRRRQIRSEYTAGGRERQRPERKCASGDFVTPKYITAITDAGRRPKTTTTLVSRRSFFGASGRMRQKKRKFDGTQQTPIRCNEP